MVDSTQALPSADTEFLSVVSRQVQEGLAPIYSNGHAQEDHGELVVRMAHEPIIMFNAATQELLSQFPHIVEMFPLEDDAILHILDGLNGVDVGEYAEPVVRSEPAPDVDNTMGEDD